MATKITDTLLQKALKDRWLILNPNVSVEWDDAYPYYFKTLSNNLICEMSDHVYRSYNEGSGSELKKRIVKGKEYPPKMLALKSSSAMTFNIFGNGDKEGNITVLDNSCGLPTGKYQLEYEKKLPALNSRAPANMDACLTSQNTALLFEMKMTEWFGTPGKLSSSYLDDNSHYPDVDFRQKMQRLMSEYTIEPKDGEGRYKCKTDCFDAFQIMKHIFGIYNGLQKKELQKATVIKLIVGFWTVPDDDFFEGDKNLYSAYQVTEKKMRKEFSDFHDKLGEIKNLFQMRDVHFEVMLLTVKEIVKCLKKSPVEMDALRRYL